MSISTISLASWSGVRYLSKWIYWIRLNRIGRLTRKIKRVKFGCYTDLCYLCNKIADDDDCKAISHRHTNVLTDYS